MLNSIHLSCEALGQLKLKLRADMDPAAELTPALLVLNKLVEESGDIRISVKNAVFPPEADKVGFIRLGAECASQRGG